MINQPSKIRIKSQHSEDYNILDAYENIIGEVSSEHIKTFVGWEKSYWEYTIKIPGQPWAKFDTLEGVLKHLNII